MTIENIMLITWIAIIIFAFIIEVNTLDLVSIWFSLGAIVAFISALIGASTSVQVWLFILSSVVLLVLTRPLAKKYMVKNTVKTNADRLIGKAAKVTKPITVTERGEVKIDGKYWLAFTEEDTLFEVDQQVLVLGIEGVKLLVGSKDS